MNVKDLLQALGYIDDKYLIEEYNPNENKMEKGDSDVSGIYGGTLERKETINNVAVKFYYYEDAHYANWSNNGFSYSYSNSNGEVNKEEIANLIK